MNDKTVETGWKEGVLYLNDLGLISILWESLCSHTLKKKQRKGDGYQLTCRPHRFGFHGSRRRWAFLLLHIVLLRLLLLEIVPWHFVLNLLLIGPKTYKDPVSWHLGLLKFVLDNSEIPRSVAIYHCIICEDNVTDLVSGLLCGDSDHPSRVSVCYVWF